MVLGHFPLTTLESARTAARDYREKARQGIDPRRARPRRRITPAETESSGAAAPSRHSIEHLVADYMERHAKVQHKRPQYVLDILKRDVLSNWKGRDARTITPPEVIELLDLVLDRGSRIMANRLASVLGQLFRWGIHRRIVEDSPVKLLYRPGGKEKPRERTLTDEEIRSLLKAGADTPPRFERLHRVITILLLTGQRRGEIALARWSDVDLQAKTWRIPDEVSKNGRGHLVPLSDWAVEEFRALKREAERCPFVLPSVHLKAAADPKLLTRNLARASARFEKLAIRPFTLHDLRRTCRTGLARLRVAPHIAERVLNHAQERIPGTYDVYDYVPEKREALEKWALHVEGLIR
jgi:integrase